MTFAPHSGILRDVIGSFGAKAGKPRQDREVATVFSPLLSEVPDDFFYPLFRTLHMRKPIPVVTLTLILRLALGALFLYTGFSKITDISLTAQTITQADILPADFSFPLAYTGIAMEIVLGFCLLFKKAYLATSLWTNILCLVFVGIFVQAWARGLDMSCNCLAMNHSIQEYPLEICLRLILLGASLCLSWDAFHPSTDKKSERKLDFSQL